MSPFLLFRPACVVAVCAMTACLSSWAGSTDGVATAAADNYADPGHWLCHPGLPEHQDACRASLDAIAVTADGHWSVETATSVAEPDVDCFYLYPTVSTDIAVNSDLSAGALERQTAYLQAARYRTACRVFAPVYRQRTVLGVLLWLRAPWLMTPARTQQADDIAFASVREAFRHYITHDNKGRGFILVGHSQGSHLGARLLAEEIEADPSLHARLVAAHLPGIVIRVPRGADVGAQFRLTRACREPGQAGCVVAFSSYRQGDPDLTSPFFAATDKPGEEALCVNPAILAGNAEGVATPYIPFRLPTPLRWLMVPRGTGGPMQDAALNRQFAHIAPFYTMEGQVRGECRRLQSGVHYLEVRFASNPSDALADDYTGEVRGLPGWGLHMADVSLFQGDLTRLAAKQAETWRAHQQSSYIRASGQE